MLSQTVEHEMIEKYEDKSSHRGIHSLVGLHHKYLAYKSKC